MNSIYTAFDLDAQHTIVYKHSLKEVAQHIMTLQDSGDIDGVYVISHLDLIGGYVSEVTSACQIMCEEIAEEIAQAQDELRESESRYANGANRY